MTVDLQGQYPRKVLPQAVDLCKCLRFRIFPRLHLYRDKHLTQVSTRRPISRLLLSWPLDAEPRHIERRQEQ